MICPECESIMALNKHNNPISCGIFNMFTCDNNHTLYVCKTCNKTSNSLRHFEEKLFFAGGWLCIDVAERQPPSTENIILFCKDITDVVPHILCFEHDYKSILKNITDKQRDKVNIYRDEDKCYVFDDDKYIMISKDSNCFQDVIKALTTGPVTCPDCGYYFDVFPTKEVYKHHMDLQRFAALRCSRLV